MSTIRPAKRRRYTSISREAINDERLSFRARGILAWLLDKPDDWRADSEDMARVAKEGRDAIRTALKELTACGYLVRTKAQDEKGRWVTETLIYESPNDADPTTGNQASDDQASDAPPPAPRNPTSDDQASESSALYKGLSQRPVTDGEASKARSTALVAPAVRPRNEVWDAVVAVCGLAGQSLTRSEEGRVAASVKQLRDVGATPLDISRKARLYRSTWPRVTLTPTALAANWSQLDAQPAQMPNVPPAWDVLKRQRDQRQEAAQ